MPWCEGCSRFFNPNSLMSGGECPECGRSVATVKTADEHQVGSKKQLKSKKIPWHFWLLVSAAGIYLGWRFIQGISALFS